MKLQAIYCFTKQQELITSGDVWKFEGSMGRAAMESLESGACFLPDVVTFDYYGSKLPARSMLKDGSKGTLGNSQEFWAKVESGEIELGSNDGDVI